MKSKRFISILIFSLTLLGIVSQLQNSVPNQEIVVQFSKHEVTSDEAQNAIAIVKQQLQTIGVVNVQVLEQEGGRLKIMYYSDTDVASIKKIFSEEKQLGSGYASCEHDKKQTKSPSDKNSISYNLDVYEIQNANDSASYLGSKHALVSKANSDQIFNPNVFLSIDEIDVKKEDRGIKEAYKLCRNIAIAIDNTSHVIPEVRAGPAFHGIHNFS
jgi:preprotein translocase subunit SecD